MATDSFDSAFIADELRKEEEARAERIAAAQARIAELKRSLETPEEPEQDAAAPEQPEQQQPAPKQTETPDDPNAPQEAAAPEQPDFADEVEAIDNAPSAPEQVGFAEEGDEYTLFGNISMGVVNGLRDALVEGGQLGLDIATLGQTTIDLNTMVPDVKDRDSVAYQLSSGFTQFGAGFIPAVGVLSWLGKGAKVKSALSAVRGVGLAGRLATGSTAKAALAGAIADSAVWSPHEERLSTMIEGTPFSNPITSYLANDENDSEFEGRMKNVLEGLALGGIADLVIGGAVRSKAIRKIYRRAITAGADTEAAVAVKTELEDAVLKRQHLAEIRAAKEALQTAGAQGTTDPVADTVLRGREALEQERAELFAQTDAAGDELRASIQAEIDQIDEALAHIDGAESRGLTPEEAVRPMQEAAAANSPLEQIRQTSPEAASKVEQNAKGGMDALEAEEQAAIAAVAESEANLVRNLADPESNLNKLDDVTRQEAEAIVNDVPPEVADVVEAATKDLPDAARIKADAAERQARIKAEQAAAREALGDGPDVFRMENGKVVMDEDGILARIEERKRKRIKTKQVIDMEDPVWFRAVTQIFNQAHGAMDELDVEALAMMSNINLERVAGHEGGFKAVQAELSDFIATHMNITAAPEGRSIETTKAMARKMVKQDAEALGKPELTEKFLESLERNFHDNIKNLDVHVMSLRMMTQSAVLEARLAGKAAANGGSIDSLTRYIHAVQTMTRLEALREGSVTALGRALSSQRGIADAVPILRYDAKGLLTESSLDEANSIIRQMGGEQAVADHAKMMLEVLDNPGGRRDLLKESIGIRGHFGRVVLETWLNAILSNPVTHAVNTTANHAVMIYLPAEQIFTGMLAQAGPKATRKMGLQLMVDGLHKYGGLVDGYKAAFRLGKGDFPKVLESLKDSYAGRAGAYEKARMLADGSETMGNFWKSLMTGEGTLIPDAKQFDFNKNNALTSTNTSYALRKSGFEKASEWTAEGTTGGRIIDAMGNFIRTSGRGLTIGDELSKTVNYHMALHSMAFRDAIENGATDVTAHIAKFKREIPTWRTNVDIDAATRLKWEELDTAAKREAKHATFTDPLNGVEKSVQDFVVKHPWARVVVPFIRTPANLMNFSLARTPLAVFNPKYWEAFQVLGKPGMDTAEHAARRARLTIGVGLAALLTDAVANGRMTGSGPGNWEERSALMATGWQPNSFVFTNDDGSQRYVSYSRMEPFSLPLQLIATYGELAGHLGDAELMDAGASIAIGLAEAIKSKSYFQGLLEVATAFAEPERKMERAINKTIAGIVPAGLQHANRVYNDRTMRDVNGLLDAMKAKIPGLSQTLPPRRNIFGEPITYAMGIGPETVSPFMTRTSENDPVNREIQRLVIEADFGVNMSIYKRIDSVELTPEEKDRYLVLTAGDPSRNGNDLRAELLKLIQSKKYKSASDDRDGKQDLIKDVFTKRRARARKVLLRENPELAERIRQSKKKQKQEKADAQSKDQNSDISKSLAALLGE